MNIFWLSPWTHWDILALKTYIPCGTWHHLIPCYSTCLSITWDIAELDIFCHLNLLRKTVGFFCWTINIQQLFVIYLFSRRLICLSVWCLFSLTFVNTEKRFSFWHDKSSQYLGTYKSGCWFDTWLWVPNRNVYMYMYESGYTARFEFWISSMLCDFLSICLRTSMFNRNDTDNQKA